MNAPVAATTQVSVAPTPDPNLPASTTYSPGHILVWFRPGIVTQAPINAKGAPEQFTYSGEQPALTLAVAGISNMTRLFPWFDHSSIYTNDVKGNPITLPEDLTDLYIAEVEDGDVAAAVAVLETDPTSIQTAAPDYFVYSSSGPDDVVPEAGAPVVTSSLAEGHSTTVIPNDLFFGSQWWLRNTGQFTGGVVPGPDIRATAAWDRTTGGSGSTQVAVIGTGIDSSHPDLPFVGLGPDFTGSGSSEDNSTFSSGTAGAGVIGARGNNSIGVAGASWGPGLVAVKIRDANDQGAVSWALQGVDWARANFMPIAYFPYRFLFNEDFIAATFKNAHATGMFIPTGTGNDDNNQVYWPAGLTKLAEGVGAVQEDGLRWQNAADRYCPNADGFGSPFGPQVKLCAPGGNRIVTTERVASGSYYATSGNCTYGWRSGTAGAAAAVSGVAALLRSYSLSLYGEDIAQILERTARDLGLPGWDENFGYGCVDAAAAIAFVDNSHVVDQGIATNVSDIGETDTPRISFEDVPGLNDGSYCTKKHEVRANIVFTQPFVSAPAVWGRTAHSTGWRSHPDQSTRNDVVEPAGWAEVVPGTLTKDGCTLRAYVYDVYTCLGFPEGWYPVQPSGVRLAWTAIGVANPTGVEASEPPHVLSVKQGPNPVAGSGEFLVSLPVASQVSLRLFRIDGGLAKEVARGTYPAGVHRFEWSTAVSPNQSLAAGVYFYQLSTSLGIRKGKVMVVK